MPLKLDLFIIKQTKLWAELQAEHPGKSDVALTKLFSVEETKKRLERGSTLTGELQNE